MEKKMKKNNAPGDWNPMGAAFESGADCTTFADDLRFAWQALGFRDLFDGMTARQAAGAAFGGVLAMAGAAGLLLLGC